MTHQALLLKLCQDAELRLDRTLGGVMHVEHASQIDDIEHIQAQITEIVVNRLGQFFGREGWDPRSILATPGANLSDDDQVVRKGMQRLADKLVGYVRAVEIAGINMVHFVRNGLA